MPLVSLSALSPEGNSIFVLTSLSIKITHALVDGMGTFQGTSITCLSLRPLCSWEQGALTAPAS